MYCTIYHPSLQVDDHNDPALTSGTLQELKEDSEDEDQDLDEGISDDAKETDVQDTNIVDNERYLVQDNRISNNVIDQDKNVPNYKDKAEDDSNQISVSIYSRFIDNNYSFNNKDEKNVFGI